MTGFGKCWCTMCFLMVCLATGCTWQCPSAPTYRHLASEGATPPITNAAALRTTLDTVPGSPGYAAYAVMHKRWPCGRLMQGYKGLPALRLSFLWHTFGRRWQCLDRWAADSRPKFLQVHVVNEVCMRHGRCGAYEPVAGLTVAQYEQRVGNENAALFSVLRRHVQPIAGWLHAHEDIDCAVSAGLESNLSRAAYRKLVAHLAPLFPARCRWVWNPVGNNPHSTERIPGMVHELHGSRARLSVPCIANLDGEDVDLPSQRAILQPALSAAQVPGYVASHASCEAAFLWTAPFNGIGPGSFTDPRQRRNWPKKKAMTELRNLLRSAAAPQLPSAVDLRGCGRVLETSDGPGGFLFKPSDVDVYGAVALLPRQKVYRRVVLRKGGKVVERLRFAGLYHDDGRQVWRAQRKASELPMGLVLKAEKDCWQLRNPRTRND